MVSPAPAGMIPTLTRRHGEKESEPRTRGDDPDDGLSLTVMRT